MPIPRRSRALALLLGLALAGPLATPFVPAPALAEEVVRDAVLGARPDGVLAAGDVHAYRVAVRAGTELRIELRSQDAEDDGDAVPGKGGSGGDRPTLVLLDAAGATLGSVVADRDELRVTVTADQTVRAEVRAGTYSGGYELRLEGRTAEPEDERTRVTVVVDGAPQVVHVDAPAHATVDLEVRRRSGGAPRIDAVTDALGRELTPFPRERTPRRVRLESIPVGVDGGLDVTISAAGGSGRYELRARVRDADDRPRGGDDADDRRVVVLLAPGADAAAIAASLGFTLVEVRGNRAVFETPEGREGFEDDDAVSALGAVGVLDAEADLRADLPEGSQMNAVVVGSDLGRSDVETQPALTDLHAAVAHARGTGTGVVVAVLDGGVDAAHPFLAGRLVPGRDVLDGDDDPSDVANGVDDDGDGAIDEGFGHGTFVASLVLAAAPDARVMPVRVLDSDGRGTVSGIAAGITWAVDQGAKVVNLSLGTLGGSTTLAEAVRYALARGVPVVAATGNGGSTTVVDFPAAMTGVVAVTAADPAEGRAPFANAGPQTTVAAPGTAVVGAYPGDRYATWTGTSFSAALASGGAALVVEKTPQASPARVTAVLRRAQPVRRRVPAARRRGIGAGVLDLARLVR